jgi:hypothetical protein
MHSETPMQLKKLAIGVCFAIPLAVMAQAPANPDPGQPDFRVVVEGTFDPETLVEFNRRVQDYAALRSRLEVGLPPLVMTTNPDDIETFERKLAERIRHARGSRRGQLFVPVMEGQLKRMMAARADAVTVSAIMDDNPGEFDVDVNETYKKKYALATMPPKLLLLLPDLPPDLQYRFVGRHLILYDGRANMIVDEIPYALQCRDCVPEPEEDHDDDHEHPAAP